MRGPDPRAGPVRGLISPPPSNASPGSDGTMRPPSAGIYSRLPSVYASVTTAYDYTEGYHRLMKHLPDRYVTDCPIFL